MRERELPNWALRSHRTGDCGKGLLSSLGSLLVAGDVISDGEAMETTGIRLE